MYFTMVSIDKPGVIWATKNYSDIKTVGIYGLFQKKENHFY